MPLCLLERLGTRQTGCQACPDHIGETWEWNSTALRAAPRAQEPKVHILSSFHLYWDRKEHPGATGSRFLIGYHPAHLYQSFLQISTAVNVT